MTVMRICSACNLHFGFLFVTAGSAEYTGEKTGKALHVYVKGKSMSEGWLRQSLMAPACINYAKNHNYGTPLPFRVAFASSL